MHMQLNLGLSKFARICKLVKYFCFLSIIILRWCLPPRAKRTICRHNFKIPLKDTLVIFDISWALWRMGNANFLRIPSGNLKNTTYTIHTYHIYVRNNSMNQRVKKGACFLFNFLTLYKRLMSNHDLYKQSLVVIGFIFHNEWY